jgi:hypothetical protein
MMISFVSCDLFNKDKDDDNNLGGEKSPMGAVGTTYSSIDVPGVTNLNAEVTGRDEDGISTFKGSAVVTDALLKNAILTSAPEITMDGDTAATTSVKIKQTKEGIQLLSGPTPGILVKYDAKVGDTYPIDGGYIRTVVSRSETDDYYYGFTLIKVIEVEEVETAHKSTGINKVTYFANHKFGLVGIRLQYEDESTLHFPVFCSEIN